MVEWFATLAPNVVKYSPDLLKSIGETLIMVGISGPISMLFGIILGVVLVVTRHKGIMQNNMIYNVLDKGINVLRSIPFIILLASLWELNRAIMGTAIGIKGSIIPLIFGTVPFFSRQVETALLEIDNGLVEAAQAMGTSPAGIIFRVYLRESIPGLIRATVITLVSLIGLSSMAGAVGAGGLGDYAIRYGYQRFMTDITYTTVLIILVMVSIIQTIGNVIIKRTTH